MKHELETLNAFVRRAKRYVRNNKCQPDVLYEVDITAEHRWTEADWDTAPPGRFILALKSPHGRLWWGCEDVNGVSSPHDGYTLVINAAHEG